MKFDGVRSQAAAVQFGRTLAVCGALAVLLGAIALVAADGETSGATMSLAVLLSAIAVLFIAALVIVVSFFAARSEQTAVTVLQRCRRWLRVLSLAGALVLVIVFVVAFVITRPASSDAARIVLASLAAAQCPLALFLLSR